MNGFRYEYQDLDHLSLSIDHNIDESNVYESYINESHINEVTVHSETTATLPVFASDDLDAYLASLKKSQLNLQVQHQNMI